MIHVVSIGSRDDSTFAMLEGTVEGACESTVALISHNSCATVFSVENVGDDAFQSVGKRAVNGKQQ